MPKKILKIPLTWLEGFSRLASELRWRGASVILFSSENAHPLEWRKRWTCWVSIFVSSADVAQLVEHRFRKPRVTSSSLVVGSSFSITYRSRYFLGHSLGHR